MGGPILQVRHLEKSFGTHQVLRDIDFEVEKGEVISIIGSSGSGKSTLLRCINMLETPSGGEIVFEHDENPINEILNGHILFHTYVGGWAPAEHIENVFEFDPTITEAALKGGAE